MEIRRYLKKSQIYTSNKETPKDEISKEETLLLPKKSKWNKLEIVGLIIILLSAAGNLLRGIQRGDLSNPLSLLVNIFFQPSVVIGLVIFLYGRVRRALK